MFVGRSRSTKIQTFRAEFELAEHALADTLADALPCLLWTANADGLAEFFNVAWREYTGLSVQESAGLDGSAHFTSTTSRTPSSLGNVPPRPASRMKSATASARAMARIA
jgi:PAS domain-containing protein